VREREKEGDHGSRKTVRFEEQIMTNSEHIFAPNGGYIVFKALNIFVTYTILKLGNIVRICPV